MTREASDLFEQLDAIDVVSAPKPCNSCGYSLAGQPIKADAVYGLRLVRCPECGEVCSVPNARTLGGRKPRDWVRLRTAALGLGMLGLTGLSGGLAQSTGFAASAPVARAIAESYAQTDRLFTRIDLAWWNSPSAQSQIQTSLSGVGFDHVVMTDAFWLVLLIPIIAIVAAVLLSRTRTRHLVALALITQLIATACYAVYLQDSSAVFGYEFAITLAEWSGGWAYGIAVLLCSWVITTLCFIAARPLARLVIGTIYRGPPQEGPLAPLWMPTTTPKRSPPRVYPA